MKKGILSDIFVTSLCKRCAYCDGTILYSCLQFHKIINNFVIVVFPPKPLEKLKYILQKSFCDSSTSAKNAVFNVHILHIYKEECPFLCLYKFEKS